MTKKDRLETIHIVSESIKEAVLPALEILNSKIDKLDEKVLRLDEKVMSLDQKVMSLDQKVDNLQQTVDGILITVDRIDRTQKAEITRSDNHEGRIKKLELNLA